MLEITRIREQKDQIVEALKVRNLDAKDLLDQILSADVEYTSRKAEFEGLKNRLNIVSKEVGILYSQGNKADAEKKKMETQLLKPQVQTAQLEVNEWKEKRDQLMYELPNVPDPLVPAGDSDEDNEEVDKGGVIPDLKKALPHWELAKKYNLIDFEMGAKVTGAGFPFYIGQGARLQRGLINFFLDQARDQGYTEIIPPFVVNEASGYGTGQLPDKEGQMYHAQTDDLYLIPTAEVPLTNMYRDVIVKEEDFPIMLTGYTPCFRREAGSYGKDVKGLNRLHQFDKVEIVRFEHPDNSYHALTEMIDYVKTLVSKLGLPYRVLRLCGGDLGFTAALTYDFEVYSAAQERWLEVSSVSNFETFQANRLKVRFKDENNKSQLVHTLNGSALALPRIMAAIIENNQTADGIKIPAVLVPYCGFEMIQ